MKVKVISDLHISDFSDSSDFNYTDSEFIDYLKKSMNNNEYIVLNGDVFECWESGFNTQTDTFRKIRDVRQKLCDFIEENLLEVDGNININIENKNEGKKLIYVGGNHDIVCNILFKSKICKSVVFHDKNFRTYIAHGHQADAFNSKAYKRIGREITRCVGIGEKLIKPDLDDDLQGILCTFMPGEKETYEIHALKMAKKYKYDAVVYGHTHYLYTKFVDKKQSIIYANTGSIAHKTNTFDEVIVEFHQGILTVTSREVDIDGKVYHKEFRSKSAINLNKFTDISFFKNNITPENNFMIAPCLENLESVDLNIEIPDITKVNSHSPDKKSEIETPLGVRRESFTESAGLELKIPKRINEISDANEIVNPLIATTQTLETLVGMSELKKNEHIDIIQELDNNDDKTCAE